MAVSYWTWLPTRRCRSSQLTAVQLSAASTLLKPCVAAAGRYTLCSDVALDALRGVAPTVRGRGAAGCGRGQGPREHGGSSRVS
jgi:hypothetical protein